MCVKKKLAVLITEEDLLVDLTFHDVPASLLTEFAEKIVRPCYSGNINTAIKDLIQKAIAEQSSFFRTQARLQIETILEIKSLLH